VSSFTDSDLAGIAAAIEGLGAEILGVLDRPRWGASPGEAAAAYAARGWPVMPLHTPTAAGCSCRRRDCASVGKHPRTAHGLSDASTNHEQVKTWWSMWPDANVGVATGERAGLVVLDIDPRHGGQDSLVALETVVGPLPGTLTADTGGGGTHVFYGHHRNPKWPTPSRGNAFGAEMPGVDVKSDGGYVVVAPSVHASGRRYAWCGDWTRALAPWPLSLAWRHAPPPPRPAQPGKGGASGTGGGSSYLRPSAAASRAALAGAKGIVATSPEGNRNNALNWAAYHMGLRVAQGYLDEQLVRSELTNAALAAGLGAVEAERTISSAFAAAGPR
jgi:hypothetical protein